MRNLAPRETLYQGVKMRSRLEGGFAWWLDRYKVEWTYEPFVLHAPNLPQYLPDFACANFEWFDFDQTVRIPTLFEIKPAGWLEDNQNVDLAGQWARVIDANEGGRLVVVEPQAAGWITNGLAVSVYFKLLTASRLTLDYAPHIHPWPDEWWKASAKEDAA